jgi:uncharacterized protein (TIGR02246 family)
MQKPYANAAKILAVLFIVATSAYCATGQARVKLQADDEKSIRKLVAANEEGWNKHDMKLLGSMFRHDAEFINVVGMYWRGKDAIMNAHAAYLETIFKDCKIHSDDLSIRPLDANHAIGVWVMTQDTFTTPSGSVVPKHQNRMTLVFERDENAGWQVVHGQNTRIDAEAAQFDPVNKK